MLNEILGFFGFFFLVLVGFEHRALGLQAGDYHLSHIPRSIFNEILREIFKLSRDLEL
jgi:hypothetical protein